MLSFYVGHKVELLSCICGPVPFLNQSKMWMLCYTQSQAAVGVDLYWCVCIKAGAIAAILFYVINSGD